MPSVLSKYKDKLLMKEWSFPYNCHEIGHSWEPSCTASSLELSLQVFEKAFKMYSGLYAFNFLISGNYSKDSIEKTAISVFRSASFLGFNCLSMFALVCTLRKLFGRFYYSLFSVGPAALGSLMAILIEHPTRRRTLAFYCANIATECVYRIAAKRGLIKSLPHGDVALFTISMAIFLYIGRVQGLRNDPVCLAVKLILGRTEFAHQKKVCKDQSTNDDATLGKGICDNNKLKNSGKFPDNGAMYKGNDESNHYCNGLQSDANYNKLQDHTYSSTLPHTHVQGKAIADLLIRLKHNSCEHGYSCIVYCLRGFCETFLASWVGQSCFELAMKATRIPSDPWIVYRSLRNSKKANLSLFISLFTLIFRTANCTLRWKSNRKENWHSLVAGLLAGPTMMLQPNSVVACNFAWKCIEYGVDIAEMKKYPIKAASIIPLIYAASVNMIFYTLVLEPNCVRPSIIRFIDQMTDHKLHQVNRNLLALFGTDAHLGYEDYFPNLHPDDCTSKFVETVMVWML